MINGNALEIFLNVSTSFLNLAWNQQCQPIAFDTNRQIWLTMFISLLPDA